MQKKKTILIYLSNVVLIGHSFFHSILRNVLDRNSSTKLHSMNKFLKKQKEKNFNNHTGIV